MCLYISHDNARVVNRLLSYLNLRKRKIFSLPYPPLYSIRNIKQILQSQPSNVVSMHRRNKQDPLHVFPHARSKQHAWNTWSNGRVEGIFDKRIAKEEEQKEQVCTNDPGTGRNG